MPERTPISGWKHIRDVLASREPRIDQEQVVCDVQALCREWDSGQLPLVEIRKLTTGYERNIAVRFTPPDHPLFKPLMRMFEALIASAVTSEDGYAYTTRQGIFSEQDIRESGGHIERAGNGLRIAFPIRVPGNLTAPEKPGQEPPQREEPLFTRTPEERWRIANDHSNVVPFKPRKVLD